MEHLPKLETLNISGNIQMDLLDIRPVFQKLTVLRSLSIADITKLPLELLEPLSNLQVLNISGVNIGNETGQVLGALSQLKVKMIN